MCGIWNVELGYVWNMEHGVTLCVKCGTWGYVQNVQHCCYMTMVSSRAANFVDMSEDC